MATNKKSHLGIFERFFEQQREMTGKGGKVSSGNGRKPASEGEDVSEYEEVEERSGGRGFASMDPEKRREIARKGGKASHGGGRKPLKEECRELEEREKDTGRK